MLRDQLEILEIAASRADLGLLVQVGSPDHQEVQEPVVCRANLGQLE